MDEVLTPVEPTEEMPEEIERHFATIGAVYEDGVSLIFDGEEAPTEKHYLCNTSTFFAAGDRVKILPDSGTYVVEYVVGPPKQKKTVGLPPGGVAGQILQKMSEEEFHAAWQTLNGLLPTGGSSGQVLKKTGEGNYAVGWGDVSDASGTLPTGGSSGQFLVKNGSTDYATTWQTAYTVPSGGSAGQMLVKNSATNGDTKWQTGYTVPTGGSAGQVLAKDTATNGDISWKTLYTVPTGGSSGQVLTKDSTTDGDVSWKTLSFSGALPTGGSTGQILQKTSATNYAASWVTGYLIPTGGSAGQALIKDTSTAGDVSWGSPAAGNIVNQYNSGSSYVLQFRTTGTYGTGASTFQIRMGTSGTWYTISTT